MNIQRFRIIGPVVLWGALSAFSANVLPAQDYSPPKVIGSVYYGTASPSDSGAIGYPVGVGGGGQAFLVRGLTAGADVAYYANPSYHDVDFGLFSPFVGYYFKNRREFKRFDPFVLGGYGLVYDRRAWNTGFGGGGFETWFNRRVALRIDMRMYGDSGGNALGVFNVGLSFR